MLKYKFISAIFFTLGVCSNDQDIRLEEPKSNTAKPISKICSQPSLITTSQKFLTALQESDIPAAKSFYYPSYLGEEYGVTYTFFPDQDKNAIFDFRSSNKQSPFALELGGEYFWQEEKGQLVLFVQERHKDKRLDERFLSEKKFSEYFACYFQCVEDEWKITRYTCFQESSGPFLPPDSDYP